MSDHLRVLIVEDEVTIARSLKQIASKYAGAEMVHSYQQAVETVKSYRPHVVLLDINLEGSEKNGIEFAQEYKEVYDFEVIFITAYFDSVTFAKANEVNPINYIIKPFKTSQISISLQLILTKINAHQEEGKDFDKTYLNKLTEEEKNVLYLISLGFSSKMISLYAKKSVKTVLNQRSNIVKKLELPNTNNSLLIWSLEHKSQITASVQE